MSLSRGLKLKNYFTAFLICGAFLFILLPQNASAFNNYNKEFNGTLTAVEWNGLFNDYVNTLLPVRMNGPLGINVAAPNEGGLFLDVNGGVRATAFSGSLAGTLNAGNVSMGAFGSNTGGGNYSFPGNVGIGVASPGANLHVQGAVANYISKFQSAADDNFNQFISASGIGEYGIWGDSLYFQSLDNLANGIRFYGGSSARVDLQIINNGNVGIGTIDPQKLLHLSKSQDGDTELRIENASAGTSARSILRLSNDVAGASATLIYHGTSHATNARILRLQNNDAAGDIRFYFNGADNVTFAQDGSVGIGTSTPGATLDVNGLIKMRSVTITQPEDVIVKSYLDSALASTTAGIITQVATSSFWQGSMTGNVYNANTGNIGIGTSTPAVLLHTYKATENALFIETGDTSNAALYLANSSGEGKIGYFNSLLTFRNAPSGNAQMVLDSAGNVGIGTINPSSPLTVMGAARFVGPLDHFWYSDVAATQPFAQYKARGTEAVPAIVQADDQLGHIRFFGYDGASFLRGATIMAKVDGTPGINDMPGRLSFFTTPDGANSPLERMTIKNNGNVGIDTTAPLDKLSIGMGGVAALAGSDGTGHNNANTYISTDDYALANYGLVKTLIAGGSGSSVGYWTMSGANIYNSNSGNVGIGTTNPTTPLAGTSGLTVYNATLPGIALSNSGAGYLWYMNGGNLRLFESTATTGGERLIVQATTGNVGIGTTDPGAYRLKVAGDVAITGALLTQTGSDFAEEFKAPIALEAGTVVVMGDEGYKSVKSCTKSYDKTVVGIVSDNPSIIAGRTDIDNKNPEKVIVAMMGVVSVKVTDINGYIEKGDLLTSSGVKGYAMRASNDREDRSGTIIGKALEDLNTKTGKIKVLVNLQ